MLRGRLLHELRQSGNQSLATVREAGPCRRGHVEQIARKCRERAAIGTIIAMRRGEIGIDVVREGVGVGSALRVTQERRIRGVEHVAETARLVRAFCETQEPISYDGPGQFDKV